MEERLLCHCSPLTPGSFQRHYPHLSYYNKKPPMDSVKVTQQSMSWDRIYVKSSVSTTAKKTRWGGGGRLIWNTPVSCWVKQPFYLTLAHLEKKPLRWCRFTWVTQTSRALSTWRAHLCSLIRAANVTSASAAVRKAIWKDEYLGAL